MEEKEVFVSASDFEEFTRIDESDTSTDTRETNDMTPSTQDMTITSTEKQTAKVQPTPKPEPWETDMTAEEIAEANKREKLIAVEDEKITLDFLEMDSKVRRISAYTKPWVDPWLRTLFADLAAQHLEPRIGLEKAALVLLIVYALCLYMVFVFVHLIVGDVIFIVYIGMLYCSFEKDYGTSYFVAALLMKWILTKIFKIFWIRTPEQSYYAAATTKLDFEKYSKSERSKLEGIYTNLDIVLMVSIIYFIFGTSMGAPLINIAPIIVFGFMTRIFPGPGGNSAGIIMMLLLMIFIILCMPSALKDMADNFKQIFGTEAKDTEEATYQHVDVRSTAFLFMEKFKRAPWVSFPSIGLDTIDLIRYMLGSFFSFWIFFDDILGAGHALDMSTAIKSKFFSSCPSAISGIWDSKWVAWILVDVALAVGLTQHMKLLAMIVSAIAAYHTWKWTGAQVWAGRGQGAVLTDARLGFSVNFGSGPSGARKFLAMGVLLVINILYVTSSHDTPSFLWLLASIVLCVKERTLIAILGVMSGNWGLVALAFKGTNPLTESLTTNAESAWNPGLAGENCSGLFSKDDSKPP